MAVALVGVALWGVKAGYNDLRRSQIETDHVAVRGICVIVPPILSYCPTSAETEATVENELNRQDLRAQQEMADWAFVVALIGLAGFLLSLVSIALIYATFQATRRTLDAAYEANAIGWHQTAAQLSFSARVLYMHHSTEPPNRPNLLVSVANSGVTAATDLSVEVRWRLVRGDNVLVDGRSRGPEYDGAVDVDAKDAAHIDLVLNVEVAAEAANDVVSGKAR